MTEKRPPKTDEEYILEEPTSEALRRLRSEIIGELLLKKKLGIENGKDN